MSGISEYKQPDKYRCLKVPLSYILRKNNEVDNSGECETLTILEDAILRTNQITGKAYLLLRLWILNVPQPKPNKLQDIFTHAYCHYFVI
jgi:hypothetical protein